MFQRFKELSEGKTAVLISHRFSSVRMADRILVLAEGEIEAAGTHEELLAAARALRGAVRAAGRGVPLNALRRSWRNVRRRGMRLENPAGCPPLRKPSPALRRGVEAVSLAGTWKWHVSPSDQVRDALPDRLPGAAEAAIPLLARLVGRASLLHGFFLQRGDRCWGRRLRCHGVL